MYGIKSDETRRSYVSKLEFFFDFYKIEGNDIREKSENFLEYTRKGKNITQKVTDLVLNYMYFHIQRAQKKEISRGTIRNFYKPIKLFCEMNNVVLNWKIISKGLPRGTQNANDRIPTIDEILEVLKFPDRRIKPVLYTMISSGIRIGAWEWLKWKNVIPIYDDKKTVIVAKIIVYDGEPDQYFSFITPEAYWSLKEWMEFREKQGEKITKESYLMRDLWNTGKIFINLRESNLTKGTTGNISIPKKASGNAIRQIFTRAWKIQDVRPPDNDIRRHEFKSTHCFRKYFETHAMDRMKLLNVKILMGHDTGLEKSYCMPSRNIKDLRGFVDVSYLFLDEADYFEPSINNELLHAITAYEEKSNCTTIMASTPNAPGRLFESIEKDPNSKYYKIKLDYTVGLDKIYDRKEIEKKKNEPEFLREYAGQYLGKVGNVFLPSQIQTCIDLGNDYSIDKIPVSLYTLKSVGLDPGFSSSGTGIVVLEHIKQGSDKIRVIESHLIEKGDPNEIVQLCWDIWKRHNWMNTFFFIDGSNRAIVNLLKIRWNESLNWESKSSFGDNIKIRPVNFSTEHKNMLSNLHTVISKKYLAIDSKHDKLLTSLRTAYAEELNLKKEQTSYSDLLDALRLALKGYQIN